MCCQLCVPTLPSRAATHRLPLVQRKAKSGPCVSFPGPPHKHRATKGETRRDDNYLHGSRCPQASPGSGAPSAREQKCRGYCLAHCPAHAAKGTVNRAAGQRQKGNQDIVMPSSTLEEGIIFSKRNLALFPAQLSWKCPPCRNPCLLSCCKWHKKDSEEAAHHHVTGA